MGPTFLVGTSIQPPKFHILRLVVSHGILGKPTQVRIHLVRNCQGHHVATEGSMAKRLPLDNRLILNRLVVRFHLCHGLEFGHHFHHRNIGGFHQLVVLVVRSIQRLERGLQQLVCALRLQSQDLRK